MFNFDKVRGRGDFHKMVVVFFWCRWFLE